MQDIYVTFLLGYIPISILSRWRPYQKFIHGFRGLKYKLQPLLFMALGHHANTQELEDRTMWRIKGYK